MIKKPNKETLDVFGRILYSLAMVDGEVQDAEVNALRTIVADNHWAEQIELSFIESKRLDMDAKMIFLKNMRVFRAKPIDQYLPFFLSLMNKMAASHGGIDPAENAMITKFKNYCEPFDLHIGAT